jgi:hypothetical protein
MSSHTAADSSITDDVTLSSLAFANTFVSNRFFLVKYIF